MSKDKYQLLGLFKKFKSESHRRAISKGQKRAWQAKKAQQAGQGQESNE